MLALERCSDLGLEGKERPDSKEKPSWPSEAVRVRVRVCDQRAVLLSSVVQGPLRVTGRPQGLCLEDRATERSIKRL